MYFNVVYWSRRSKCIYFVIMVAIFPHNMAFNRRATQYRLYVNEQNVLK